MEYIILVLLIGNLYISYRILSEKKPQKNVEITKKTEKWEFFMPQKETLAQKMLRRWVAEAIKNSHHE